MEKMSGVDLAKLSSESEYYNDIQFSYSKLNKMKKSLNLKKISTEKYNKLIKITDVINIKQFYLDNNQISSVKLLVLNTNLISSFQELSVENLYLQNNS